MNTLTEMLFELARVSGGQTQAAKKCGTSQQTYSQWLRARARPQAKFHYGIGKALGISEEEVARLVSEIPSSRGARE